MSADAVVDAAHALVAQLALYEEGWERIRLTTGHVQGRLVVREVDVQLAAGPAPAPSELLDGDPGLQTALISGACARLAAALGLDAPAIDCTRGDRTDLVRVSICAPIELAHDDEWLGPKAHDMVRTLRAAAHARQTTLDVRIDGHVSRAWPRDDPQHLTLAWPDGRTLQLGCSLIGSFDRSRGTWLWGWANPQLAHARLARPLSTPGLRILDQELLSAQEAHAVPFAQLAAGERALYVWANPAKPVVQLFAIDRD